MLVQSLALYMSLWYPIKDLVTLSSPSIGN